MFLQFAAVSLNIDEIYKGLSEKSGGPFSLIKP